MVIHSELGDAAELGAVDDRSVRVWVRAPGQPLVPVQLAVEGCETISTELALRPDDDWIGVADFSLSSPAPDARFACTAGERRLKGRLGPSPDQRAGLTFGFASCNQLLVDGRDGRPTVAHAASMFPLMLHQLQAVDARFVLFVGDQIYSEVPRELNVRWPRAYRADRGVSTELLSRYRRAYRAVFGHPDARALREAFPTYCIWDDHDILGDWGSHYELDGPGRPFFRAASRAFCDYQHLRNPGGALRSPPYNFEFRHGDVGFLVLDSRGERSHRRGRVLGATQWEALDRMLAPDLAPPVSTLFVVLTVPIAHVATWFVRVAERFSTRVGYAARDRWNSRAFRPQRDDLLRRLFAWQQMRPERQVILVSGDVHAGNVFTIRPRHGPGLIHQITSSPVTTPIPLSVRLLTPIYTRGANVFESDFRFERRFSSARHNFGIVSVTPLPAGGHRVEFDLHQGPMARFSFEPISDPTIEEKS